MRRVVVGLVVGLLLGSAATVAACGGWKVVIEDVVTVDGKSFTVLCSAWIWDAYVATTKTCEAY
jgi:hypothetical protein